MEKPALLQRLWRKYVVNPDAKRSTGINFLGGLDSYLDFFGLTDNESGEKVSVKRGRKIDIAFSCINVLSQDIATLPFNVRQDTNNGKVVIKNSIQYKLIHTRPNHYTSAFNFWYNMAFDTLSYGNGYAFIKRSSDLKPESIHQLHPSVVTPIVVDGEVFYQVKTVLLNQDDVLHFKLYSFDGVVGVSPIIHNAESFGKRIKLDKYTAKVMGTKPPGVLTFEQELNSDQRKENREAWKRMTQGDDLGGTPVLSGGAKYIPLMVPPNEGQMIESAELSDERITGMYRVPPTMIQNYRRATFSNAEQQDLVYLKYSLTPILRMIEQECDYKLFTEKEKNSRSPIYTKFNIKAMLRGDIKTQSEWYKMLRSYGLASANTILEMEDMPPLEGETGDMVLVQGAMIPLDQLKDFYANKGASQTDENSLRQLGFDIERLKEAISRQEILNDYEK